jgi:hypothetical protein
MKFRPAAFPLITVDPYFSVWSCADALYGSATQHWSGKLCPILAGVFVGDQFYSVSGFDADGKALKRRIYQRNVTVTPTSTVYRFENHLVTLELTFTTPLLLDRLDILTRPVSYVSYKIENKTDQMVRFLFGISARGCVDNRTQRVGLHKTPYSLACGNVCQSPLAQSGDTVMIDWGYLHLCDRNAMAGRIMDQTGKLEVLPINNTYNPYHEEVFLFTVKDESEGVVTLAYDEIQPIEYFGTPLKEYYTKYFDSFGSMVQTAKEEYPQIKQLCDAFDAKLSAETGKFGQDYQNITALAYRQAIAAHKLVEDEEGNILFLSKEDDSNGCIGTLDVTYPSIPLFLKFNPELVNGMLRPILRYAKSDAWIYDFPPHDVGQYPLANGQIYGSRTNYLYLQGGSRTANPLQADRQMPVEEAGNMLLCLAAVKKYSGDQRLFDENRTLMKTWADYLVVHGYDPVNQLCTDDFAGRSARNCNLSLKAILGIAAYADLAGDDQYLKIAKDYASQWEQDAKADHIGTRLTFDQADTWSLKYNMVWDTMLGYGLFCETVKQNEIQLYLSKMNRYGVPLDCRSDYTKVDWLMWSTCITWDDRYFEQICRCIVNMLSETLDRVPFTDWYYSSTADYHAFRNRSVVGGLFMPLLN